MKRQHPYALLRYTTKNFWLLLIPLVRGLVTLSKDTDFQSWLSGAEWDILVIVIMLSAAVIRWYFTRFEFTDSEVVLRTGIIGVIEERIPYDCVSVVSSGTNILLKKIGAVRINIDTDAPTGVPNSSDILLIVSPSDRARLFNLLNEKASGKYKGLSGMNYVYKVSKKSLVFFSVFFSSALSGTILLGTFFTQGGKILGEQLENYIMSAVTDVTSDIYEAAQRFAANVPFAAVVITLVIAVGFIISFVSNLLMHLNFTISRRASTILVSGGFFNKRQYFINSRRVNYTDMQQNLLMKLFGVTSVNVSCTGYGKQKREIPVFVPICSIKRIYDGKSRTELLSVMKHLLPEFSLSETFITPNITYIMRFIAIPIVLIFAIMILGFAGIIFFQEWYSLISFITILLEIPAVWLLLVKSCAYCTNGINIVQKNVCIKYCKGYRFHTVTVPLERVAYIDVKQTVFQRMNKSCDVVVHTNSEYRGSHRVRGMPLAEVNELLKERALQK